VTPEPPAPPDAAQLAAESGGEIMRFDGEDDLEEKMSVVRKDIRGGYNLSFRPSSSTAGLHTIRVQVLQQKGRLQVLARKNYSLE
jgi:hypothetical protein